MREFFALKGVFKTKPLVVMALMVALSSVLAMLEPFINPTQRLFSFSYLPCAMVAICYGPWAALVTAFVADFTGFLANPTMGYFFGYALSAMTSSFLCALFFYRRPVSVWRAVVWRLLVIVIVVFGMNNVWMSMMTGKTAAEYFTFFRLVRNLIQFPIDVFLTVFLGRYMRRFVSSNLK